MSTPNGSGASGRKPQPKPAPRSGQPRTAQQRPGTQPQQGSRPAAARQATRPTAPRNGSNARPTNGRPTRGVQPGLVRPAPKAKVRKARLLVSKVDVWSVLKLAFLLSVALGVITVVAGVLLWTVFDVSGVFTRINELVANVLPNQQAPFDIKDYASMGQMTSLAVIIAVVNVVLLSALSMVAAFIYNLAAGLVGGVSLTLTDD